MDSGALQGQILAALRELLAGFQQADRVAERGLLRDQEDRLYAGLVSALMRMAAILFAEDRGLLPLGSEPYATSRSLTGLHAQLRADRDRHGASIDERHFAWARVVGLFRLLHGGAGAGDDLAVVLPARGQHLFDPDAYPFLEGRPAGACGAAPEPAELPRVPDGVVLRVLDGLLVLEGEPLRYKGLDVEHLGTLYEGLMGFEVRAARGESLALQPLDVVVDLEELLARRGEERVGALRGAAGLPLAGKIAARVERAATVQELAAALSRRASPGQRGVIARGALFLQPGEERRRLGAHYTSRSLTAVMVERTLGPLLRADASPEEILDLKVCDPAMGSGAFLLEACRQLADALVAAWQRAGGAPVVPPGEDLGLYARRLVATRCLYGLDRDPLAVDLARISLWLLASGRDLPFTFVDHALRHGDALVGLSREQIVGVSLDAGRAAAPAPGIEVIEDAEALRLVGDAMLTALFEGPDRKAGARALAELTALFERPDREARARAFTELSALVREGAVPELARRIGRIRRRYSPFHWEIELPEVFAGDRRGFDAFLGNPPWVSYAGRASQPLADELRDFYGSTSPAFFGFRNLQGLFVHRCATLLRPGGRLGLVLPTSMSDLGGYEPSRRAHDALCACDKELPDFGDRAFEGVFQPSMGLLSTRRAEVAPLERAGPWPLSRSDLDPGTLALLDRLAALPRLPPHLFGERGFQTVGDDVKRLRALGAPEDRFSVGVRVGGDIEPFVRRPPRLHCDPGDFGGRFRPEPDWRAVKLLIRQTARFPMVALSDGAAFRNSILAGFSDDRWSELFLVAYLNSSPVRWFHYMRHRDARQGMPQMKITHLRALPAPRALGGCVEELTRMGGSWGARNRGLSPEEQRHLDQVVAEDLGLTPAERSLVGAWSAAHAS